MAKRWTKQEDEILVKLINNGKLPKALKEVSASLGRTECTVRRRWIVLRKKENLKYFRSPYTEKEDKIILDYITDSKNINLLGLYPQLNRSKSSVLKKVSALRKKHPELKIKNFTKAKIDLEDLKSIMEKEISSNKHNLQQAFRNIADKTGLTKLTVEKYWYGYNHKCKSRKELNRKNMPALFYTSDSKGSSKNEKNTNVMQVSKGKYLFNMITSWLNNKFKVKSTTKKNSK
jgi:hypothetical protein